MKVLVKDFPFKWVIRNGELTSGIPLGQIMDEMSPEDVYIKGCNALDIKGNAGVLFGHSGGGTIGFVMASPEKERL